MCECRHVLNRAEGAKTRAEIFRAVWSEPKICRKCGASICRHSHRSLRGCMLQEGHIGPHFNPHSTDGLKWNDEDGRFVCLGSHSDWVALVEGLGRGE